MNLPDGFYVIHQPKYPVPSVFDLNERGMFSECPKVSGTWGFRILVNTELRTQLQIARLVQRHCSDPQTGKHYNWEVDTVTIDLDNALTPDPARLAEQLQDATIRSAVMEDFNKWHDDFVPMSNGNLDQNELQRKLYGLVDDTKVRIRNDLVRKNRHWVSSNIPRRVHDFKHGLYNHVKDRIYNEYCKNGGEDSEEKLIKKIALFNRVLENCGHEDLLKPNGSEWKNEDEIWQCWVGFAGSESEAHRVCRTMDTVFRSLQL
jgi:hypothetical protein